MTTPILNDASSIETWCVDFISNTLNLSKSKIDPTVAVDRFGLDSATAVSLIMELEETLNVELAPELLFEYPTLRSLSQHLASRLSSKQVA
ncbi:acyl carrier protein [Burkholderia sp. TSV86]|uniref:acyl carrier protein n=1 Tax=Burkholderia sp. TSV86 TaxID=1385594 RepID=UPI000757B8FE|nr:acyl carrier protein [Burkholderia sp. TSV86]KVE37920.1 hypothetical protein WS68_25400 [Burkholderia sp. TSV86]